MMTGLRDGLRVRKERIADLDGIGLDCWWSDVEAWQEGLAVSNMIPMGNSTDSATPWEKYDSNIP